MAAAELESKVRIEGGDVWIKATPGRLKAFLSEYHGFGEVAPQSRAAADKFLELLVFAARKLA